MKKSKKKVLVIVAHPDDETIWMGGTILKNRKDWNITILSLCRRNDKDRAPKFKKVCRIFNAKSFMSNLEDEKLNKIHISEITKRIKKLSNKDYDYIFTHGKNGEYGHIRHKEVHKAVKQMIKENKLSCKKLFFFSYKKKGRYAYANSNADKFIKLAQSSFKRKKELITIVYGFDKGSFEEICCRKKETFDILK